MLSRVARWIVRDAPDWVWWYLPSSVRHWASLTARWCNVRRRGGE